jgi:hypothetical protein
MRISDNFFKKTLSIPVLRFIVASMFTDQCFRYMGNIVDMDILPDEKKKLMKQAINSGVNEICSWRNMEKPSNMYQFAFHLHIAAIEPSLFKAIALDAKKKGNICFYPVKSWYDSCQDQEEAIDELPYLRRNNLKSCLSYVKEIDKVKTNRPFLYNILVQPVKCFVGAHLPFFSVLTAGCIASSFICGPLGSLTVAAIAFADLHLGSIVLEKALNRSGANEYFSNIMNNDIVQKVTQRSVSTTHLLPIVGIIAAGVMIGKFCTRENVRREENAEQPALIR